MDRVDGVADHGERAVAQQIDLDQPRVLRAVLLELDDRHREVRIAVERLHRGLDRHVIGERVGAMTTPPGWTERWRGSPTSGSAIRANSSPAWRQVEPVKVGVRREQIGQPASPSSKNGIRRVTSRISPAGRPCTLATSRSAPRAGSSCGWPPWPSGAGDSAGRRRPAPGRARPRGSRDRCRAGPGAPGLRKRSNRSPAPSGSTWVMPRQ